MHSTADLTEFLSERAPYGALPEPERAKVAAGLQPLQQAAGRPIYQVGDTLDGLYLIAGGRVQVRDANGALVSLLGPGNSFGERGLLRGGVAVTSATAETDANLWLLPRPEFDRLRRDFDDFSRFFERARPAQADTTALASTPIGELMTRDPIASGPDAPIRDVAALMRDRRVSCVMIVDDSGAPLGIVTNRDLTARAVAEGLPGDTPAHQVMTPRPATLGPDALGGDVLFEMFERGVGHLPVVSGGRLIGIVTQTDITRIQALSSATLIREIRTADSVESIAEIVKGGPDLLAQLVELGRRHDVVTRLITDISDAVTKRVLALAEAELGPAPVPYLWLACGSQGRREQTGVSDQDNCLILSDSATPDDAPYFEALAAKATRDLAACGYVLCPGEMMASTPRWRQPAAVWRRYFETWIAKPDPTSQLLASVMFDLRPIHGESELFDTVIGDVLERAAANSIFVAHMVSNAVGHAPPLGLFGGVATIRSGEHKETIDLKHNGVAPVVDLARIYALQGQIRPVNTRMRLEAAIDGKLISQSGGRDLLDAYDLIAEMRLHHQATQIRAKAPIDNFMRPATLSDLERSHLRDAFVVVRTMQSALSHSRAAVM